jgi:hypothetical protein
MRQHPLDSEVGFPGIGRPKHSGNAGTTGTQITVGRRRKRNRHQGPGIHTALRKSHSASVSQCDAQYPCA